jgi:outer membrane biosynthesis protein TonB
VNFAATDWLPFGVLGVEQYRCHFRVPVFSHDQLLLNLANEKDWNLDLLPYLYPCVRRLYRQEKVGRQKLYLAGITQSLKWDEAADIMAPWNDPKVIGEDNIQASSISSPSKKDKDDEKGAMKDETSTTTTTTATTTPKTSKTSKSSSSNSKEKKEEKKDDKKTDKKKDDKKKDDKKKDDKKKEEKKKDDKKKDDKKKDDKKKDDKKNSDKDKKDSSEDSSAETNRPTRYSRQLSKLPDCMVCRQCLYCSSIICLKCSHPTLTNKQAASFSVSSLSLSQILDICRDHPKRKLSCYRHHNVMCLCPPENKRLLFRFDLEELQTSFLNIHRPVTQVLNPPPSSTLSSSSSPSPSPTSSSSPFSSLPLKDRLLFGENLAASRVILHAASSSEDDLHLDFDETSTATVGRETEQTIHNSDWILPQKALQEIMSAAHKFVAEVCRLSLSILSLCASCFSVAFFPLSRFLLRVLL